MAKLSENIKEKSPQDHGGRTCRKDRGEPAAAPVRSAGHGSHRSSPQHFISQESARVMFSLFFKTLQAKLMIKQN